MKKYFSLSTLQYIQCRKTLAYPNCISIVVTQKDKRYFYSIHFPARIKDYLNNVSLEIFPLLASRQIVMPMIIGQVRSHMLQFEELKVCVDVLNDMFSAFYLDESKMVS